MQRKTINKPKQIKKWAIYGPNKIKTVGEVKIALSGYEDTMELLHPIKIFMVQQHEKPYMILVRSLEKSHNKKECV